MKSDRIVFSKISDADISFIYKGLSDEEVTKFYGVHFDSFEEIKEQMVWYKNLFESESGIWWKFHLSETDEFVGAVGFNSWDKNKGRAEIGCWILPKFWGKGYGTEALKKALEYSLKEMELKKVLAFIDSNNGGIKKVLKKLNFEHFKTSKELDPKNGNKIDVDQFKLIN